MSSKIFSDILSKSTVRCPLMDKTILKLEKAMADSPDNLLVISDFDYTISRSKCIDGSKATMTDEIFDENIKIKNPDDSRLMDEMKLKYSPIEHDLVTPVEAKIPHMEQWWRANHEIIVKNNLDRTSVKRFAYDNKNLALRDGCADFVQTMEINRVPFIVYSAGIGNVIETLFDKYYKRLPSNLHIISNWMDFNQESKLIGFKPPLIHCYNKNAEVIPKNATFLQEIANRTNVLLLGDNSGDANLDLGLVDLNANVLKIGFFNRQDEELLPKFTDIYDIVLVDDQTFDIPNKIIQRICALN